MDNKKMHSYKNMAKLIKKARGKAEYSQIELAVRIGMGTGSESRDRRGQFISNIERGLSSLPVKYWKDSISTLGVTFESLRRAYVMDTHDGVTMEYYK